MHAKCSEAKIIFLTTPAHGTNMKCAKRLVQLKITNVNIGMKDLGKDSDFLFYCRSESLTAESRSVQTNPNYRLMKSRSESDLSQPESDEEGSGLVSNLFAVLCGLNKETLFFCNMLCDCNSSVCII